MIGRLMDRPQLLPIAFVVALLCTNLYLTASRLKTHSMLKNLETYTYVGNDFPELLPLNKPMKLVDRVFTNNTASLPIHGPDAASAWSFIYPSSFGFVRLGPERRLLCVSMFHQLHCIDKIRRALEDPDDPVSNLRHLQHCMNYIRQMILCGSDLTLEPAGENGEEATGDGVTHTCRDHTIIYDTVNDNDNRWLEYWEKVQHMVDKPDGAKYLLHSP